MKYFVGFLLLFSVVSFAKTKSSDLKRKPAGIVGTSEVEISGAHTFLRISGASAKAIYEALTVKALPSEEEGGDSLFKDGQNYRCFLQQSNSGYNCDFMIADPAAGTMKGFLAKPHSL